MMHSVASVALSLFTTSSSSVPIDQVSSTELMYTISLVWRVVEGLRKECNRPGRSARSIVTLLKQGSKIFYPV